MPGVSFAELIEAIGRLVDVSERVETQERLSLGLYVGR